MDLVSLVPQESHVFVLNCHTHFRSTGTNRICFLDQICAMREKAKHKLENGITSIRSTQRTRPCASIWLFHTCANRLDCNACPRRSSPGRVPETGLLALCTNHTVKPLRTFGGSTRKQYSVLGVDLNSNFVVFTFVALRDRQMVSHLRTVVG